MPRRLFPLGQKLITPGAARVLQDAGVPPSHVYSWHGQGYWGIALSEEDKLLNDKAVETGEKILSTYLIRTHSEIVELWVTTEADRSATKILLPGEY